MRNMITVAVLATVLIPAAAMAEGFHVDDIAPGEGAESDCFTAYWRVGAKPLKGEQDVRDIVQAVDDYGYIKIDKTLHTIHLVKGSTPATWRDGDVTVTDLTRIVHVVKSDDGNTYELKGKLTVTYRGEVQTLAVLGESFCYSGG